jgi:adenosylmethionine-8-amino-7-oxononanoate aminotransferase
VQRVPHMSALEQLDAALVDRIAAVIIEPLIQGAAGMRLWPKGMLAQLQAWCRAHDILLILDEVMTGFGRTGKMFACQHENVVPDILCLAKGLTGGYLPLAATLTTQRVYEGFLGEVSEGRTLYYGHSYTGSQLGCAAALASLRVFEEEQLVARLPTLVSCFSHMLDRLQSNPHVLEIRQCGLIAGIELVHRKAPCEPYPAADLTASRVCLAARKHGLLTRPIVDTIVLMPPLCATELEMNQMVDAVRLAIEETCGR